MNVQQVVFTVRDVTLSGLESKPVETPRATVLALHGGGYSASYWDNPLEPESSLLTVGAALGYHVIALDRPGYGRSHGLVGEDVRIPRQADIVLTLLDDLYARDIDRVFLIGHSMGAILAIHCAADPRGKALSGIEFSGLPLDFKSELADPAQLAQIGYLPDPPDEYRRELFYGPDGTYDSRILEVEAERITRPTPAAEIIDATSCPVDIPSLAPRVTVPVHYTMAEFENSSNGGPDVLARGAALFTNSPRVVAHMQTGSGHNISLHKVARAYHLRAFAFFDEVLASAN
jgi:pimeloyl-ACP methyl ester carboxylesterase